MGGGPDKSGLESQVQSRNVAATKYLIGILFILHQNKTYMKKEALIFLLLLPTLLMAQSNNKVTGDFLQSFADAFNAHDVTAIMSQMTDD